MTKLSQLLLWLCKIPSPTGNEELICDAVFDRFIQLGFSPKRYANSLVVKISENPEGHRIVLAGHLDVVSTEHDGPPRIEVDRLFGPGSSDMKSGLALMIHLAEEKPEYLKKLDVTLVFYSREEGPFLDNELGVVLEKDEVVRLADFAICLEPSDNRLSLGACGSIHATLTFHGKTSHSARPWQGVNAIHRAGKFLSELSNLEPIEKSFGDLIFRTVTSATFANGGRGRNVVPDVFTLNVNHRFSPGTSIEEAKQYILDLVDGDAEIIWTDLSPSALPFQDHPMTQALIDSGVHGIDPKQAWTDVARFSQSGIAAVNWGPGVNAQAHQKNEWTSLSQLEEGRIILERWFEKISLLGSFNEQGRS